MRWLRLVCALLVAVALVVLGAYVTVPNHSTDATHFDTLIVLGCPARGDGTASFEQRERVMEAVREFRAERAQHMILSGAAAHNRFVEADVMAQVALDAGVPASAIVKEPRADNTIQNIFYSHALMEQHGWRSAEVISSPNHLPRAALILGHWHFPWRTDAARWPPEYSRMQIAGWDVDEAIKTAKLRILGFPRTPFLPGS